VSEGTTRRVEEPVDAGDPTDAEERTDAGEPIDDDEWSAPGYAELQSLGRGPAGRVVAAVDETTGDRVAIMYFDAERVRSDTDFRDELRSHVEQMKSIDSKHVARIHDFVEEPGRGAAIVMALVNAVSLREMLDRKGPLRPEAALVVLKDSLLGLAAAHSLPVPLPHGDLAPDIVLIDADGWCMLAGFDITVKTGRPRPTEGTAPYLAPELWAGALASPTTDIYAATAVLWESVTGQPPFSEPLADVRGRRRSAPAHHDWVDKAIEGLIASGMAKDPADRPQSARSFIHALEAAATDAYGEDWEERGRNGLGDRAAALLPSLPRGRGRPARGTRRPRRRRVPLALMATVVVLAVAVVALAAVALPHVFKSNNAALSAVTGAASSSQVIVSPPVAASTCATPSTFTYTGSITAEEAGTLTYQWVYSSGKPGPVDSSVFSAAGTHLVSGGTVSATTTGQGWAEIKLLGSAGKVSNRASYQLLCTSAKSGVTLSATVQPRAQTLDSCAATPPPLTATGSIKSNKAGTLSYYWALANGQRSAVRTLAFKAAGTKSVPPLQIQPPALPASGEAVLVVTKPVAAASQPAKYTVSCLAPIVITPTPAAGPTAGNAPTSGAGPVKSSAKPGKSSGAPTHTATKGSSSSPPTSSPPTSSPPTSSPPTSSPPTSSPPTSSPPTSSPPTSSPPTSSPPTSSPPTSSPPTDPPTSSAPTST
jgi:eukaryotic-like serine/threonine-protein kinase